MTFPVHQREEWQCRCTPENRAFWDFVERAAREWRAQEPAWARRIREQAQTIGVDEKVPSQPSRCYQGREKRS